MSGYSTLSVNGPFDLALCLKVSSTFSPEKAEPSRTFRCAVRINGSPLLMEVRQPNKKEPILEIISPSSRHDKDLKNLAHWMLFGDLDLKPFYRLARGHPKLSSIIEQLRGLKPFRPPSLFEMAVTAITEQQISLAAACRIRLRLIETFGNRIGDLWAFPAPERLARASIEEIMKCGLSYRKATYVSGITGKIADGSLDLDLLKGMGDEDARSFIMDLRGFGRWSADYILIRGLGRMDCIPADDLGIQTVVGKHLGKGSRLSSEGVQKALEPFKPYRGLAAFYLLAHSRLHAIKKRIV